jgi:hypothetical protein
MTANYEILTSVASPLATVSALGLRPMVSPSGTHHVCTLAGETFHVTDAGFLAQRTNGMFQSGNSLDFAALFAIKTIPECKGVKAFEQGARLLLDGLADQLPGLTKHTDTVASEVGQYACLQRRLYDVLRLHSYTGEGGTCASLEARLRRMDVDRALIPGSVSLFDRRNFPDLRAACRALGVTLPPGPGPSGCIVVPYFADYGRVACLEILTNTSSLVRINSARLSYSNLLNLRPDDSILMHASSLRAAAITCALVRDGAPACCISVQTDMAKTQTGMWMPQEVTFVDEGDLIMGQTAILDREGVAVYTTPYAEPRLIQKHGRMPWSKQVIQRLLAKLDTTGGKMDPEVKLLLESCRHNISLRHNILAALRNSPHCNLTQRVGNVFNDGMLISNSSVKIYSTTEGYRFCHPARDEDGPIHELSNFTMQMVSNIAFP